MMYGDRNADSSFNFIQLPTQHAAVEWESKKTFSKWYSMYCVSRLWPWILDSSSCKCTAPNLYCVDVSCLIDPLQQRVQGTSSYMLLTHSLSAQHWLSFLSGRCDTLCLHIPNRCPLRTSHILERGRQKERFHSDCSSLGCKKLRRNNSHPCPPLSPSRRDIFCNMTLQDKVCKYRKHTVDKDEYRSLHILLCMEYNSRLGCQNMYCLCSSCNSERCSTTGPR
jgi:hypothetical protein